MIDIVISKILVDFISNVSVMPPSSLFYSTEFVTDIILRTALWRERLNENNDVLIIVLMLLSTYIDHDIKLFIIN